MDDYFNQYIKLGNHELTATFAQLCHDGNLEAVSCIIDTPQLLIKIDRTYHDMALNLACRKGYLDIVNKFQLNADKLNISSIDACEAACYSNHKHIVKFFLDDKQVQLNLDRILQKSLDSGRHEIVKLILTSNIVKKAVQNNLLGTGNTQYNAVVVGGKIFNMDELLIKACEKNDFLMVKMLLLDDELPKNADIHFLNDRALTIACSKGNLDIVKFLLNDPQLTEHANIHAENDSCLINATMHGNLELIKYLTTDSELKDHIDIHVKDDWVFIFALKNDRVDIAKFLLTDSTLQNHVNITKNIESIYDAHYEKLDYDYGYEDQYKNLVLTYIVSDYQYIAPTPDKDILFKQILNSLPELNKLYEINKLAIELKDEIQNNKQTENKRLKL